MLNQLINFWSKSEKLLIVPIIISVITALLLAGTYLFLSNILPDKIPLFYSLPWGQAQLVSKEQFYILPIIIILTSLVNFLLVLQLHDVQMVLKRILTLNLILINLIISITAIKILLIFI